MKNPDYKAPCPCGECEPRSMIGTSWWKNLGFGHPSDCAEALYKQGYRYLSQWACMYCTGNNGVFDHYPKCEQCSEGGDE